ncbi:MAG: hypothetical protein M3251_04820 [Thermoproteota archaeon]|nr:hypothetical protein [Thermoproteota archaeon]MDQ3888578.1 hypothetical protein [Thermoproteota archaeon]
MNLLGDTTGGELGGQPAPHKEEADEEGAVEGNEGATSPPANEEGGE